MIYFVAFLSPLFYGLSVLIDCFLSVDIFKKPSTICFYAAITNGLFAPLLLFLGTPTWPEMHCFVAYIIMAFIDIAYLYPYYIALKKTDTSVVSALFALGKISIPLLSFLVLGDVLTPPQYLGFFIILFASVILNMEKKCSFTLNSAFYLMLLSGILRAVHVVVAKYALNSDESWVNAVIYPSVISGMMVFSFLLVKNFRLDIKCHWRPYTQKLHFFISNEFVCFLGDLTAIYALSKLSPVVSAAIRSTSPLFLLLCAALARPFYNFKEFNVPFVKKIICFFLMILGVFLVS